MNGRRFLAQASGLVGIAILCAVVSNALARPERKLRWIGAYQETGAPPAAAGAASPARSTSGASATGSGKAFPPHPDKPWIEVSGDDVAELFARKSVPILDARRTSVYRDGHIAGARSFPVWEADVDDRVKAFFAEGLNQSAPIVIYCSGGDCEDSHMLAQKLYFVGFDNVLVYKDGFPDWQKRGLPVRTGGEP
ncbi:MAG TPA: rhodanese-like domain-containing protein [Thermoanaerobaculia bacterium]